MPEGIMGANGDDPDMTLNFEFGPFAAVVWHLEDVHSFRNQQSPLHITSQKNGKSPGFQEQNNGIIVLDSFPCFPVGRWMNNCDIVKRLAGKDPPDWYLKSLNIFDKPSKRGNHWVSSQPDLSDLKISDDIQQTTQMIVMSMCQDHNIEPANAAGKEVGTYHILSNGKAAFVAKAQEPSGCSAAPIDQHSPPGRELDQYGIALADIQEGDGWIRRRRRLEIAESQEYLEPCEPAGSDQEYATFVFMDTDPNQRQD
jgi:hypothetical protein